MKETYLIADSIDTFKDAVFQHIVSEAKKFSINDIESLLKLVDKLKLKDHKLYKINFNGQLFVFTAINLDAFAVYSIYALSILYPYSVYASFSK